MRFILSILCLILFHSVSYCQQDNSIASAHSKDKYGDFIKATQTRDKNQLKLLIQRLNNNTNSDTSYQLQYFGDTDAITTLYPGIIFLGTLRSNCKNGLFVYLQKIYETHIHFTEFKSKTIITQTTSQKEPLIKVHGNILYSLNYRSYIDTPYAANDVYQHTLQAYLDVTLKNQYPMRIYINTHFSNTPLLHNFTNLNFQYNSNQFVNNIKNNLKMWSAEQISKQADLEKIKALLDQKNNQLQSLKGWLNDPVNYQRIIEEREHEYIRSHLPHTEQPDNSTSISQSNENNFDNPSTNSTSNPWGFLETAVSKNNNMASDKTKTLDTNKTINKFQEEYAQKQKLFDSLSAEYAKAEAKYKKDESLLIGKKDSIIQAIQTVRNIDELRKKLRDAQLPDSVLPKGYKKLLAIKSFGIGTMPINYSELSIKNINITGAEIEYNPSWYLAFASGFISYQFRNYFLNNQKQPKQYVTAVRFGRGQVEGNHVIVTWYTGKRYTYNYTITNDSTTTQPRFNLMGFTVESRYQLDKNNSLIAEYAKSSIPYYSNRTDQNKLVTTTFGFNDRSNEAYSVKLQSYVPATQTKVTATYRRLGINFQSFSLFTNSATQNSWYMRLSQPFFKRQLTIDASLRQYDFYNPYVAEQYSTKAVFKSIQATLRMKKVPIISLGYFPSSQLMKLNDDNLIENIFYTLVGTVTHSYRTKTAFMNTSLIYTQFYNKQTDSNFIYFNTKNIMLSQSMYFPKFTMQANASAASNHYYNLYVLGGSVDYKLSNWLTIGGGLKYNHQTTFTNNLIGYSIKTKIKVPQFGDVEVYYDKGFIPGVDRNLVSNNIGRVTYFKTF